MLSVWELPGLVRAVQRKQSVKQRELTGDRGESPEQLFTPAALLQSVTWELDAAGPQRPGELVDELLCLSLTVGYRTRLPQQAST